MKHFLYSILAITLCLIIASACSNDNTEASIPPTAPNDSLPIRRTVLVYMVAQNSLGKYDYHHSDSAEIMAAHQYVGAKDRMLVFIDDDRSPRLYRVDAAHDRPTLVYQWQTDFCSTDPQRFGEVLTMVSERFSASEYGLVLWSHADGWMAPTDKNYADYEVKNTLSFGIDTGSKDMGKDKGAQMDISDMTAAVSASGIHLKYLFFDACLMQNLETAFALRHVADYVVASPVSTPAAGSYYTNMVKSGLFSDDPADIARTYLSDVQNPSFQKEYDDFGLAIACVRTDKLQALADTLRKLLPQSVLQTYITSGEYPDMTDVTAYQYYSARYYYRPHNFDARQAVRKLFTQAEAARIERLLDDAVVFYGSTQRIWIGPAYSNFLEMPSSPDDYCSVSLFVPQPEYTTNAPSCQFGDLNEAWKDTEWYKYLTGAAQ